MLKGDAEQIYPFTREYEHPCDRIRLASQGAQDRFLEDGKRFRPEAYERHSLLRRGEEWRCYTPEERAVLHGFPPSVTDLIDRLDLDPATRCAARNSVVGSSVHLPSFIMSMLILLQLAEAKPLWQLTAALAHTPDEAWLRSRVVGTCLQPGRVDTLPCCLSRASLSADMTSLLEL